MTTREIYFKVKYLCELPAAMVHYTYKDENNVVQIGRSLPLSLRDKTDKNIELMKATEGIPGFMFWNCSPKGEAFFSENRKTIGRAFYSLVLNNR